MTEFAQPRPRQTAGVSRVQKIGHPFFWSMAEKQLNRLQTPGEVGPVSRYPWMVDVHAGVDGGVVVIERPSLNEQKLSTVTVNFSRDELDGHLTYLRAEREVTTLASGEVGPREVILAAPREFVTVEFNPLSVVLALRGAANHMQTPSGS